MALEGPSAAATAHRDPGPVTSPAWEDTPVDPDAAVLIDRPPRPTYELASPWRRAAAWATDGTLFAVPAGVLAWWAGAGNVADAAWSLLVHKSVPKADLGPLDPALLTGGPPTGALLLHAALVAGAVLAALGVWIAYRVGCVAWRGATIGKWLWGIRVVREEDVLRPPTLGRSFRRWLLPQMSGLVPFPGTGILPCLWLLRDQRRQGAHDKAARTLVLRHGS